MHRVQNANSNSAVDEWLEMLGATEWNVLSHTYISILSYICSGFLGNLDEQGRSAKVTMMVMQDGKILGTSIKTESNCFSEKKNKSLFLITYTLNW